MKSRWSSLVIGSCNVFGLALLALSATAGGSSVRAGDPSTLQNLALEPIAKIVLGIEQRVADLEATVMAFADSFTAQRIVTRELCVADGSGAQTCISKAQLDALLRTAIQVGQRAATGDASTSERAASADTSAAPVVAATMPSETPPVVEPPAAAGDNTGALAAVAAAISPPVDKPAAAAEETMVPMVEAAAATVPMTDRPAAAAGESGVPRPAEAAVMPQTVEPAVTAVAVSAKPETLETAERSAKDEEPVHTGSVTARPPAPELNAVPAEAPQAPRRPE